MSTSFAPTQAELALVNQIFAQGDPQKLGILTGDVAVRIFTGAKLPPATLGEIWGLADEDNNGWLSRKSCAQAVRLMGWAQKGEKVNKDLVNKPGPIPVIDGVSSVTSHSTGMSIPRSPPPMPNLPSLTPQDKAKFHNMFVKANPTNGLLTGEQARDIFVKSKLPNDKLLQIWNLADTQDRGALDASDFAIGMYFIQGVMSNQISVLPQTLPPSLYQQAAGGVRPNMTGTSGSFSPSALNTSFSQNRPYIQPQYTGQSQMLQPQSTGMAQSRPPKPPAPSLPARPAAANPSKIGSSVFGINGVVKWDVTAAEKAQSDGYFDKLDANGVGYIEGDVAVPFMLESKLPGDVLAQVWDLSDLNNDGRLTRDGFAVAMHLISKKLAGNEVPSTLPPTLIPPSMRANGAAAASPFQPVQQPQEPTRDLFSFDETPPTSAVSPAFSHTPMQPQATGSHLTSPMPAQDPFGASTPTRNLMDDDDEQTISPPIQDQSAEIGNIQNQLNSTNRSLDATKSERQATEQNLASQAAQLSSLQTQLSSAKAAYETETKLLSALKERFANQGAEIQKTREELIRSESDLSAVRVEKAEIEGAFLRDKEEARELHRKMVEAGQQAETLKAEVEKVKKDAKQQKGLLAIARKQLSSKEAEKAKAEKELAEARAEQHAVTQERSEVEAELQKLSNEDTATQDQLQTNGELNMPMPQRATSPDSLAFAASTALPASPEPVTATPTGSIGGKSNNPFERLAMSNPSSPRAPSPFLPFANASVPTPPVTNGNVVVEDKPPTAASASALAPSDDPFGFAKAFEEPSTSAPEDTATSSEVGTATPKADTQSPASEGPASPTTTNATDDFKTPPTTSSGFTDLSPARQTTAEMTAAKFPDIDDFSATASSPGPSSGLENHMPGHFAETLTSREPTQQNQIETDLSSSLKEIEADDDDSDSSDEDEVPLAELAKQNKASEETGTSGPTTPAPTSFDDAFGVSSSPAPVPVPETDAFGMPVNSGPTASNAPTDSFGTSSHVPSTTESGVNAFDEAMGKISAPSSTTVPPSMTPQFSFDTAFEDNFDFASAGGSTFPPAPAVNGNGNAAPPSLTTPAPAAASTPTTNNSDGFESLFSQPAQPRSNTLGTPNQGPRAVSMFLPNQVGTPTSQGPSGSAPGGSSFDEIFSGLGAGDQLPLGLSSQGGADSQQQQHKQSTPSTPTASDSVMTSPPRATVAKRSMTPPPRAKSPTSSKMTSPKNRPSTSSSKDGNHLHEKEKKEAPPTRTSKLSIRLPFGKKKKHEAVPPVPPASHLTPPVEEPLRQSSPAVEDDAEAVKQLTDMGFSRSQAVGALEKYGYDIPRALNSLLGQQ